MLNVNTLATSLDSSGNAPKTEPLKPDRNSVRDTQDHAAVRLKEAKTEMNRAINVLCGLLVAVAAMTLTSPQLYAQIVQQAVGGVSVNADGVVEAPSIQDHEALSRLRDTALEKVPQNLEAWSDLRAVSLKQIEAQVAEHLEQGSELPEAVRYLGGLQRVKYVFVYPDQNDIVLAGPAEGWRVDALGNVVGTTTGRSVLLLEDLVVALRGRDTAQLEAISCSIDPTPEGMQRFHAVFSTLRQMGNPDETLPVLEEALGPQKITVTGVPQSSHFARTLVAADFRMKRLAMGFEPSPVGDIPSFMDMLATSRGTQSATPRWWLAPKYDSLARDAEGLAWQIRGQGVECLTEEDHFNAEGKKVKTTKGSAVANNWAKTFTRYFTRLADHDSSFGQLRNAIDLAVVAALLDKEELLTKAGLEVPSITQGFKLSEYYAPQQTSSKASFVHRRRDFVISASGGVQIVPWQLIDKVEEIASLGETREKLSAPAGQWVWE